MIKFHTGRLVYVIGAAFALTSWGGGAHATTILFNANFDGTTVTETAPASGVFLAQITKTNLDAGTSVGDWTVNQSQLLSTNRAFKSIQGVGAANVTNKALRFGIGLDGGNNTPLLTANLASTAAVSDAAPITLSFDYANGTGDTGGDRSFSLIGLDGTGLQLFDIVLKATTISANTQISYRNTAGTIIALGGVVNSTGSSNNNLADYDDSIMKNVSVVVDGDSYDVLLDNVVLGDDLAFRNLSANGLAQLQFVTRNSFTGGWFDNVQVSAVPEPGSLALLGLGGLLIARRRRA